jgi:Tfp pilus assembly protein PilZ
MKKLTQLVAKLWNSKNETNLRQSPRFPVSLSNQLFDGSSIKINNISKTGLGIVDTTDSIMLGNDVTLVVSLDNEKTTALRVKPVWQSQETSQNRKMGLEIVEANPLWNQYILSLEERMNAEL